MLRFAVTEQFKHLLVDAFLILNRLQISFFLVSLLLVVVLLQFGIVQSLCTFL